MKTSPRIHFHNWKPTKSILSAHPIILEPNTWVNTWVSETCQRALQ